MMNIGVFPPSDKTCQLNKEGRCVCFSCVKTKFDKGPPEETNLYYDEGTMFRLYTTHLTSINLRMKSWREGNWDVLHHERINIDPVENIVD